MATASSLSSSLTAAARQSALGSEVYRGLTASPKTLSPWLFYDSEGSRLFEQITDLPEYYVTRTEREIFATHAEAILERAAARAGAPAAGEQARSLVAIELGAGTASKTGLLLEAAVRRQGVVDYYAIDVSETALEMAKEHLEHELAGVRVHTRVGDYTEGLGQIEAGAARRLVLYIGSSIGNFEPRDAAALLADVRNQLAPGDRLLLGADQVKDVQLLVAAYDDAAGVTAAFNRNMLARINRELDADFCLDAFAHVARWNERESRMEMHLKSRRAQQARVRALDLQVQLAAGETIHTENSYKFTDAGVKAILEAAGFSLNETWKDPRGWFGVYLAEAQ